MRTREVLGSVFLTTMLFTGCGNGREAPNPARDTAEAFGIDGQKLPGRPTATPGIKVQYLDDGSKLTSFSPEYSEELESPGSFPGILQFCDGAGGMVTVTELRTSGGNTGYAGGGADVVANYPPCDDGRLTASDFAPGQ